MALANRGPFSPRFRLLGSLRGNCGVAVERAATWPTHAPGQIGFRAIGRRTGRSVGGPGVESESWGPSSVRAFSGAFFLPAVGLGFQKAPGSGTHGYEPFHGP